MEHLALGNYILVEDAEEELKTEGGLVLVDSQPVADTKRSKIVSISEQLLRNFSMNGFKYNLKVGDFVYHAYHIGTPVSTKDRKKLRALHIDNVLSVEV